MSGVNRPFVAATIYCLLVTFHNVIGAHYLGKSLGKLSELHHGVSGEVFAVDGRTLHIKDFTYDGQGPAAYFWAGTTRAVGSQGFRIRDENGSPEVLRRYRKEGVTITLPDGKTLKDIKWFSVWCEEFAVNFGDVKIPRGFEFPRPQKIEALRGVHGISSDNIVIVDAQTLLVPNLSYDGEAPDAKFWVGKGSKPSPQGIRVPDENGKEQPLRKYDRKTVVLTLPGDLTVFNIDHFGIWCEAFTVDFGHVQIPQNLNVPPSLKMLGVSPQKRVRAFDSHEQVTSSQSRQLVGGHFEATTYRPLQLNNQFNRHFFGQRRTDEAGFIQQQSIPLETRQQIASQNSQQLYQQQIPQQQLAHQQLVHQQLAHQQLVHQQLAHQQQIPQQQLAPQQLAHQQLAPQKVTPQQQQIIQQIPNYQLIPQQIQHYISERIDPNVYNQQQNVPYVPIHNVTPQQRQLRERVAYEQILQNRRLLEEQEIKEQLNRQRNRFDLSNVHYQRYV